MKNLINWPGMMFTISFSGQQTCYWGKSLSLCFFRWKAQRGYPTHACHYAIM